MAEGIRTAISIDDKVTAVLRGMVSAIDASITAFERMGRGAENAIDPSVFTDARAEISRTTAALDSLANTGAINIPVSGTEQLVGHLQAASMAQDDLNDALSRMDAEGARRAYEQLSNTVVGTERYIRDNQSAQQGFNNAIKSGTGAMDGLVGKIKAAVGAYAGIQGVKKLMDMSDELSATTARLTQMNQSFANAGKTSMNTQDAIRGIYEAAQNARGEFGAVADVVARFGNNAGDAFSGTDEVIAFSNLVQKQMAMAGASSAEASNAMLQLSQALGSGVLRGDELNSIFEQAPNLIQTIADYMDVDIGQIRAMASEGQITADIVKNAMFEAADDINSRFEQMPHTWTQIWTMMGNSVQMRLQPVLQRISEIANSEGFQTFANNALNAFSLIANGLMTMIDMAMTFGQVVSDNWGAIGPIIGIIVGAIVAYNVAAAITAAVNGAMAIAQGAAAAATAMQAGATFAAAAAQNGFNAALLASPIGWIAALIVAIVAAIIAFCQWVANATGMAQSWFGVLTGGINVVIQFFINLGMVVANIALGIIAAINAVAQNIGIAFGNAIAGAKALFYDLLATAMSVIGQIANALNALPFVELDVSGLTSAATDYANKAQAARDSKEEYVDVGKAFSDSAQTFDAFKEGWASDAFKTGADWGDGIADSVGSKFDSLMNPQLDGAGGMENIFSDYSGMGDLSGFGGGAGGGSIPGDISDISKNTGKTADAVEIADEDIKYLRDISEQEAINRYTTASVNVDFSGMNNTINNGMDFDSMMGQLANSVQEAALMSAAGVY